MILQINCSQTIVVGIDFKRLMEKYLCVKNSGKNIIDKDPPDWAERLQTRAGEIV